MTIPEGWQIDRHGSDVIVVQKNGECGYAASVDAGNIASTTLHALARDILAVAHAPSAGGEPDVGRDFSVYRDQCSVTPDDPVTMKRHQANAYMASMRHLGLEERAYLPDSIRALQAESTDLRINYTACVHGRQSFRQVLREKRAEVKRLQAENAALQQRLNVADQRVDELEDAAAVAAMRIRELDLTFGRYLLGMKSAVIADKSGGSGMEWIFNGLAGPGELPPEDECDAQAYFDREVKAIDAGLAEVFAFHDARRKAKQVKP